MKSTGVVRRIDDLGRIVIPKELRKTLKIRDGESLEIFIENDTILLKKFSSMDDMVDFSRKFIEAMQSHLKDHMIAVTDMDQVLSSSNKEDEVKEVTEEYRDLLNKREVISTFSIKKVALFTNDSEYYISVYPLIVDSDVLGGIVIYSSNSELDDFVSKISRVFASFLEKNIEQ